MQATRTVAEHESQYHKKTLKIGAMLFFSESLMMRDSRHTESRQITQSQQQVGFDRCKKNPKYPLVVASKPERKINVKIRSLVVRVVPGNIAQRATSSISRKHYTFGQNHPA